MKAGSKRVGQARFTGKLRWYRAKGKAPILQQEIRVPYIRREGSIFWRGFDVSWRSVPVFIP